MRNEIMHKRLFNVNVCKSSTRTILHLLFLIEGHLMISISYINLIISPMLTDLTLENAKMVHKRQLQVMSCTDVVL